VCSSWPSRYERCRVSGSTADHRFPHDIRHASAAWVPPAEDRPPHAGSPVGVDSVAAWISRARAVELEDITNVEPIRRTSLRVTTRDGKHRDYGIGSGTFTPIWSKKNPPHRDEMLHEIRRALRG
jgi:hypothetical protein